MSKIYIAGKITGDDNFAEKFRTAAEQIQAKRNCIILNPAELPKGMSQQDYMKLCFAMIDVADEVYFLPDYIDSNGAQLEFNYCLYTRKKYRILQPKREPKKKVKKRWVRQQ